MKRFLLSLAFLTQHSFSFGQTQIPLDSFYVPGTSWTEVATTDLSPCSTGDDISNYGILYKIERDSIISGKTYHLVSSCDKGSFGQTIDCSLGPSSFAHAGSCPSQAPIFAMIRTDSNRVYFTLLVSQAESFIPYGCDSVGVEYLFYDFNLSMGSIIPNTVISDGGSWPIMDTVSVIDSDSLSNGNYVKRYNRTLVYGVGSRYGFINYWSLYVFGPGPSAYQYVLCYDNPHFSYHFTYQPGALPGNLQNDCFDMDAYINSINAPTMSNLYPNPATQQLTVTNNHSITSICIMAITGQTIYNQQVNAPTAQIYVAELPAGLYFIKINGSEIKKFVKE